VLRDISLIPIVQSVLNVQLDVTNVATLLIVLCVPLDSRTSLTSPACLLLNRIKTKAKYQTKIMEQINLK
jgi:hypothetical protein